MELYLKLGIDNLKFGMTQSQVVEILGEPDRTFAEEGEDESRIVSEWNKEKLRLTFYLYENQNDKLAYIRTINPVIQYNGQKIIGVEASIVKDKVFNELQDWAIDEYDFFTDHFNSACWLCLKSEFGVIVQVEMGVPFKNENDYDWPE